MKRNFTFLVLVMLLALTSCSETVQFDSSTDNPYEVSFTLSQTRVSGSQFESGDKIAVDAYDENGDLYADNKIYTYNDGVFTSSDPIQYSSEEQKLEFVAVYPVTSYLSKSFTYTALTDQSSDANYESSDLLISGSELTSELTPVLSFSHKMASVILNIDSESTVSSDNVTIWAQNTALCNVESMSFSAMGDKAQIKPMSYGIDRIVVLVAPQSIEAGTTFASTTLNGVSYTWSPDATVALESGRRYEFDWTLDESTSSGSANVMYTGWAELPTEQEEESGNYYYAYHMRADASSIRNFAVCYSKDYMCPVWVAAPMHTSYLGDSGRSDAYGDDPSIPFSQTEYRDGYTRGHLLGSSDRTISYSTNKQTFYLSNIAPQLSSGFNTGGGVWNNLEDFTDLQLCADTLYQVIGAHWENTRTVSDGTTIPTHYYKILLRTKNGNSGESVLTSSRDDLKCVAFIVEHNSNQAGDEPSTSMMRSVAEMEEMTGHTFFPNVPNAPKDSYSASDWGL
ncbi:MAG: fimbrillin family protein [Rikenellaceae bacterium]